MFPFCYAYDTSFFIELASANIKYNEKLNSSEKSSKILFAAGWKVEELNQLVDRLQKAIIAVINITKTFTNTTVGVVESNLPCQLSSIRETATSIVQDLSRHQRTPATHIFVMMISSDQRDVKPYALPVQCLPYHSINQQQMRQLVSKLVKEMVSRGMKVAG